MSDSRLVTSAARSYFDELMRAGVRIWEYHGRMLHSKTIVVDHHYSLIGTANFDSRSFRLNFEVCIAAYGPRLAELLSDQFECDLVCAERVPSNRHIGLLQKMFEATARLFSPLL
jgi:cardiolipin synthase